MSVQRSTLAPILGALSLAVSIGLGCIWLSSGKQSAFVNASELFEGFKMKKTLEADFKKVESARKTQLDSMALVLRMLDRSAATSDQKAFLEYKKQEFAQKQQEYGEADEALSSRYNEQIWNQLNQYIKDYGDEKGYDYIFGATGNGTLMYASDKKDITKDLIRYVNEKYEGVH